MNVAQYFDGLLSGCGRTLKEVAAEAGFAKPNVLSMIRNGDTKLPVSRAPNLALSVGSDPRVMLERVMAEYHPEIWDTLRAWLDFKVSAHEIQAIEALRGAARGDPFESMSVEVAAALGGLLDALAKDRVQTADR